MRFIIILIFLSSITSCTTTTPKFDSDKWLEKGKEHERLTQLDALFNNILSKEVRRDKIISLLGPSEIKCDSINQLYGTFHDITSYESSIQAVVILNESEHYRIIKTKCGGSIVVDRYLIGYNPLGPDYILFIYKDYILSSLTFEMTEF